MGLVGREGSGEAIPTRDLFTYVFEMIMNLPVGQRSFRPNGILPAGQCRALDANKASPSHVELLLDTYGLIDDSPVILIKYLNRAENNKNAALFDKVLCWEAIYYLNCEKYDIVHVNLTDHVFAEDNEGRTLSTISYIVRNFLKKGELILEISENVELNLDILGRFPDLNFVVDDVTLPQLFYLQNFVGKDKTLPSNLLGIKIDGDMFSLAFGEPKSEAEQVQRAHATKYIYDVLLFCKKYDLDFTLEGIGTEILETRVFAFLNSCNKKISLKKIYLQGYLYC